MRSLHHPLKGIVRALIFEPSLRIREFRVGLRALTLALPGASSGVRFLGSGFRVQGLGFRV